MGPVGRKLPDFPTGCQILQRLQWVNPCPSGALPPVLGVNSSARWGKPGGASLDALAALCPLPTIQNDEIHHCLEA